MSFEEKLRALAERVPSTIAHLATEEATKNALILPFIAALGYDVFNPLEVIPEFTADVGLKKGEKVDYAIKHGDQIVMLFEAKKASASLNLDHASQLFRYFAVTQARIGVLTNGVVYRFFSDLDAPNKMDEKPFLEIDMLNLQDELIEQLAKLTKEAFDLDRMLEAAGDLKYMREIRRLLHQQFDQPHDEFVRFFFNHACPSRHFVQSAREQFAELVKRSLRQVVEERFQAKVRLMMEPDRAESGLQLDAPISSEHPIEGVTAQDEDGIVTSDDELAGFHIVRAIVCSVVPLSRLAFRDTKSYFGVLLDDNNRKPICRLHFNRSRKYVGLFDENRNETRHPIEVPDDIYQFADQLRATAQRYLDRSSAPGDQGDDSVAAS